MMFLQRKLEAWFVRQAQFYHINIRNNLFHRDEEKSLVFLVNINDRIIAKMGSLLSFNAIIIAIYAIINRQVEHIWMPKVGMTLSVTACLVCFPIMDVNWRWLGDWQDLSRINISLTKLVTYRTAILKLSIYLTIASTAIIGFLIAGVY